MLTASAGINGEALAADEVVVWLRAHRRHLLHPCPEAQGGTEAAHHDLALQLSS